jgi:hypothetical protein
VSELDFLILDYAGDVEYFGGAYGGVSGVAASGLAAGDIPAGGRITVELPSGSISLTFVQSGDDSVTVLVVEGRDFAVDRLAQSAFGIIPTFLDADGDEYQPSTVHTKVVLKETGAQIIAETEVVGWAVGQPIVVPATWTALVNTAAIREEHIIRIIGDNANANARNELRMIVGCLNPER